MRKITSLVVIAVGLNCFSACGSGMDNLAITGFSVNGNQGTLFWSGGRPNYQVQTRADFNSNWTNLDGPTTNNFATVPVTDTQAYFRVVADYTAQYQVVFDATWSQATHPIDWTPMRIGRVWSAGFTMIQCIFSGWVKRPAKASG